ETNYKLFKSEEGTSFCEVEITTGRFHQIRRHFDSIDHPLIGDPRYGEGNKNKDGLKLVAHKCEFFHPKKRERMTVELAIDKKLF
ncbi:MAG: tRNA pseudouridine32 synthase/23S rRNA pseudouridine746 synthase, partial [Bacteriovoracaceae bacterium]